MNQFQKYIKRPKEFLAICGYTMEEFQALLPFFAEAFQEWMRTHQLNGKPRGKRPYTDYKNSPLPTIEEKLFFILVYLKTNNLQTVQGALFNISQPKANQWIHTLHPVLNQALNAAGELPARQMADVPFVEDEGTLYWHDGVERPLQRPVDAADQTLYYSGKKKPIP
jgi:hypothetical protein